MTQPPSVQIPRTQTHILHSDSVNDDFEIRVLPPPDGLRAPFPVVYATDATSSFGMAADGVTLLQGGAEIPPVLLIGIAYPISGDFVEFVRLRTRDFSPTSDARQETAMAQTDGLDDIVTTAEGFVKGRWGTRFDCIVQAPPSVNRASQPVVEMARALGNKLGIPICEDAVVKAKTTDQMKDVQRSERDKLLKDAIQKGKGEVNGRRILLVDDLCESGATLRRTAEVLLGAGAKSVHALVMTRTK